MLARNPIPDQIDLYRLALDDYVVAGGEAPLHRAYEIGRQMLGSGYGLLALVNTHQYAVLDLLRKQPADPSAVARLMRAASNFLLESLSPFEMLRLGSQESNAALRRLNGILEEEARRIAHTLHEESAQILASTYLELAEILREAPPAQIRARVECITSNLDQVREQLRRLSHELRPPILDQLGLLPALQFLADGFHKRHGLRVKVKNLTTHPGRYPQSIETTLYRIAQEALNNITRHAHAEHAEICVWDGPRSVLCSIFDDGVGFTPPDVGTDASQPGLGLLGIQERVASLHGSFDIRSAAGAGTELHIAIPMMSEP